MDINDILSTLGLDFSNSDVKQGALAALDAILDSRQPPSTGGGGMLNNENELEIDPDLIQPSQKFNDPGFDDDLDIEIDDEDEVLSQVKRNQTDANNAGDSSETGGGDSSSDASEDSSDVDDAAGNSNSDEIKNDEDKLNTEDDSENSSTKANKNNSDATSEDDSTLDSDDEESAEDEDDDKGVTEISDLDNEGDSSETTTDDADSDSAEDVSSTEPDENEDSDDDDEPFDFDEEDLLDDALKDRYDDQETKAKHEARRIKRERTIQAAKKALADATARKVSQALIHELENAIKALEELTEAVKSLKSLSDEDFNKMINRVFDAIEAVGDKSLTFSSDEERAVQAQEIKADLASSNTQSELSAEDIAQIRAEHQAVKAREKEADKYKARSRQSFKGFQDFLSSLYRAIALQVTTDEVQDDTWSAINRRHSGTGVLQPGKRINDLPNKKIPVIDFYFDCSGSWDENDIAIGQKAVSRLADMEENGQIKINVYYFASNVHTDAQSARNEGSTDGWNEIVKNVIATQATNVIIMTDADMERWWKGDKALSYTVPGYVWYLWRDGENAPRLPRDLKGRGGTQQFSFSRGDL